MLAFFRKIRKTLIDSGSAQRYLLYAIGEIILVVIGILIALQINNWNEERKSKATMLTNIRSIAGDIAIDNSDIEGALSNFRRQKESGDYLLPVLESNQQYIVDSLAFILQFNELTYVPRFSEQATTWDYLNSSGVLSEFPDTELLVLLKDYYQQYNKLVTNFNSSALSVYIDLRHLKHELMSSIDHLKIFPTKTPSPPSSQAYNAILNDKRVLPLVRDIWNSSVYFETRFVIVQKMSTAILDHINKNYTKK